MNGSVSVERGLLDYGGSLGGNFFAGCTVGERRFEDHHEFHVALHLVFRDVFLNVFDAVSRGSVISDGVRRVNAIVVKSGTDLLALVGTTERKRNRVDECGKCVVRGLGMSGTKCSAFG